jgi:hypothetical protein
MDPTSLKTGSGKKSISHQMRIPNTAEPHHFTLGLAPGKILKRLQLQHYGKESQNVKNYKLFCSVG